MTEAQPDTAPDPTIERIRQAAHAGVIIAAGLDGRLQTTDEHEQFASQRGEIDAFLERHGQALASPTSELARQLFETLVDPNGLIHERQLDDLTPEQLVVLSETNAEELAAAQAAVQAAVADAAAVAGKALGIALRIGLAAAL